MSSNLKITRIMRKIILSFISVLFSLNIAAKPKVVVGITVEDLRYDCLQLFWDGFSTGGFKKLAAEGMQCVSARYPFAATDAAADLAALSTSSTAFVNGIVDGEVYDREQKEYKLAVYDASVSAVGENRTFSAANLQSPTFADRLFERNYGLSKVFSAAVSPETAILQSGHSGECYWVNNITGKWASSSYYMDALPVWVSEFTDLGTSCSKKWMPMYPASYYTTYKKGEIPFAYELKAACNGLDFYDNMATTPYANDFVCDFVLKAIDEEKIGADLITDALFVGLSAKPFFMQEGKNLSMELEDAYIRLDKCIERLLMKLEIKFGKDGFLLYVAGTRSAMGEMPPALVSKNLQWQEFGTDRYAALLNSYLKGIYGIDGMVAKFARGNVFLNHKIIEDNNLRLADVQGTVTEFLFMTRGVLSAATAVELSEASCRGEKTGIAFNRHVSGDVLYTLLPMYYEADIHRKTTGFCAHKDMPVPLFLYGEGIDAEKNRTLQDMTKLGVLLEWISGIY